MGAKGPEILFAARPTRLRLGGFLALALGGVLIGLGSLTDWATVSPFDTPTRGVDIWEGILTLAIGVAVLVGMIVMRLLATQPARRAVAIAILVLGLVASALAAAVALNAERRFTAPGERDRIAMEEAARLGLPFDQVRDQIEVAFDLRFQVSLDAGVYLVIAGGLLGALGGALSLAWATGQGRPGSSFAPDG
ncbi:MAG TPA: hypothetical protein VJ259_04800 [Actinomycetota bacterium]|nr:hypothetical protein [Actinomycetota bacterium]